METFYRSDFTEIWIRLTSGETLGILDTDYLEDYFGIDGQVTLHHLSSGERFPIVMAEQTDQTPGVPHDVFAGYRYLSDLPDGDYQVEGRVRDLNGSYSILSAVQNPYGGETVILLQFRILVAAVQIIIDLDALEIRGGYTIKLAKSEDHLTLRTPPVHAIKLKADVTNVRRRP